MKFQHRKLAQLLIGAVASTGIAFAGDVNITKDRASVTITQQGKTYTIERIQDQSNVLTGGFAKTSRKCPPFCIQPMSPAPGVATVGELELIDFLENKVAKGTAVLIDARTPSWHKRGTIPGSVNIPFNTFTLAATDPTLIETMGRLGVRPAGQSSFSIDSMLAKLGLGEDEQPDWDFKKAKSLLLWCNGPWCGQSPRAIKGLLALGYPADKLHYYRGGMQTWQILGMSTVNP